jgi:dsDNA-specific endonuclease/ATPase MutS2
MPKSVIAAARENLTEPEKQLAEQKLRSREDTVREREDNVRRRLDAKLDDHLRDARCEIDAVIEGLKARAAALSEQAAVRLKSGERLRAAGLSTGDTGAVRADARAALDQIADRPTGGAAVSAPSLVAHPSAPIEPGSRVTVGALGFEGVVIEVHGKHAEVDVRGKRLRAAVRDLRVIEGAPAAPKVSVHVELQPRQGLLSELNVIGADVDETLARLEKFLDGR